MSEPLTVREFERWCEDDRALKTRILDHIERQEKQMNEQSTEIAVLKSQQSKSYKVNGVITTIVSAIVSGTIGALKS